MASETVAGEQSITVNAGALSVTVAPAQDGVLLQVSNARGELLEFLATPEQAIGLCRGYRADLWHLDPDDPDECAGDFRTVLNRMLSKQEEDYRLLRELGDAAWQGA